MYTETGPIIYCWLEMLLPTCCRSNCRAKGIFACIQLIPEHTRCPDQHALDGEHVNQTIFITCRPSHKLKSAPLTKATRATKRYEHYNNPKPIHLPAPPPASCLVEGRLDLLARGLATSAGLAAVDAVLAPGAVGVDQVVVVRAPVTTLLVIGCDALEHALAAVERG